MSLPSLSDALSLTALTVSLTVGVAHVRHMRARNRVARSSAAIWDAMTRYTQRGADRGEATETIDMLVGAGDPDRRDEIGEALARTVPYVGVTVTANRPLVDDVAGGEVQPIEDGGVFGRAPDEQGLNDGGVGEGHAPDVHDRLCRNEADVLNEFQKRLSFSLNTRIRVCAACGTILSNSTHANSSSCVSSTGHGDG